VCLLHMHSSHANTYHHSLFMMVAFEVLIYRILVNPTSCGSQLLGGVSTNLYLSIAIYRDCPIMEAWLPFHDM